MVCLESTELSDTGRKRQYNEDACLRLPDHGVFCVADGMGGVAGGDLASEAITTRLQEVFIKAAPTEQRTLSSRITLFQKAIDQASQWIKRFADEKGIKQMGSTVVALLFDPEDPLRAVGLHAGDSRLYRFRAGALKLLTSDHTAMAVLSAKLGREGASLPSKFQNHLVRAVGLAEAVDLEQTPVDVRSEDLFLLCSDGLSRMLPDSRIAAILGEQACAVLDTPAKALLKAANTAGGKDNITVILVRAAETEEQPTALHTDEQTKGEPDDSLPTQTTVPVGASDHELETCDTIEAVHGDILRAQEPALGENPVQSTVPVGRNKIPRIALALLLPVILLAGAIWFQVVRREGSHTKVGRTNAPTIPVGIAGTRAVPRTAPPEARGEGGGTWTNKLGMSFAEVPGDRFWMGTSQITAADFEQVMGAPPTSDSLGENKDLPAIAKVTYREAKRFAEQLNRVPRPEGGLPSGYPDGRFALPTTDQWKVAIHALDPLAHGVGTSNHYAEWCVGEGDQVFEASFFSGLDRPNFEKSSEAQTLRLAFRLVLVP